MLDLKFVRENIETVLENTRNKNSQADAGKVLSFDEKRRAIIVEVESLKNLRNVVSKEIAALKKDKQPADDKIAEMKIVSDKISELDSSLRTVDEDIRTILLTIPNMTNPKVPVGKDSNDNKVVRTWGTMPEKKNIAHMEIARNLGIIDFERGAKVAGAGFSYYMGKAAKLERALINFMLNLHVEKHGYTEMFPPFLVNESSMYGTGQLPKMAEDMYHDATDNLYLIPTAEVPVTNYHSQDVLRGDDLPVKYCAYSPCFRREAGGYGKEVRGCLRVHQFNKVELVNFTLPEESYDRLELLVSDAEDVLKALGLHYRVLLLCTGDTSFSSAMTYDLEVWAPGEQNWLEVSSCSNFEDFQARRANIRFKRTPNSKPEFVHTLNGSALATSRIMVAILETYLREDGRVDVPEVLRPFCGFDIL